MADRELLMSTRPGAKEPPHRFLTVDQVADELNVRAAQIRAMLHSGEIRGIQVGGRRIWRIGRADLEQYIEGAYRKTAERFTTGDPSEDAPEVSPQLARALQATKNVWRNMEAEFGLLSGEEVSAAVGRADLGQTFASNQRAAGNLIGVEHRGRYRYPGFQIDRGQRTVRPVMRDLLVVAQEAGRDEESLALWMVSPTGYLQGVRPVDRIDDPAALLNAARQSFNVEW